MNQQILKENLSYNSDSGLFTWLKSTHNQVKIGDVAGTVRKGYICIRIKGKDYAAHRLAWVYVYGELPYNDIDHINHNTSDNRIVNLRIVNKKENQHNASIRKDNTSGFTGVTWHKVANKWMAQICIDGTRKNLGYFTNLNDAISARQDANIKYGYHANHGKMI